MFYIHLAAGEEHRRTRRAHLGAAKQPVHSYSRQIQGRPGAAAERDSDGAELKRPGWQFLEGWDGWSVANNQDHQLAGDVLLGMPTEGSLAPCRQWGTVPVCSFSAGEAPDIDALQGLLEFKKALEDSKVNESSCITFCGFCPSALFININICTMNHVCPLWLFITVLKYFFFF